MRKGLIIGFMAAVIGIAAASCTKEDPTLAYNNATMGNIVDGVFTSDQGNKFNIVEQRCPGKLDTMKRAFIVCDVLKQTAEAENEYDVRLNYIANVLTKDARPVSEIENLETYMNDPIILTNAWVSGGYLNLYITIPVVSSSKKVHEINLLHELKDGIYRFEIRHNAQGEILKEGGDNSSLVLANAYVSFPVNTIIKEDEAKMTLDWKSYVVNGTIISAQTTQESRTRDYLKSTFEQVPVSAASPASTLSLE